MRRHFRLALAVLFAIAAACDTFGEGDATRAEDAGTIDAGVADASQGIDGAQASDANASDASSVDAGVDATDGKLFVFVTSSSYANVASPDAADATCKAEAEGRLAGKFVAWFSSFGMQPTPAPERLVTSNNVPVDGPWYRVDGKRVVANRAALSQTATTPLENAIALTASGAPKTGSAWTATHADGGAGQICSQPNPNKGLVTATDTRWTEQGDFTAGCSSSLSLYCFQVE